MKNELNITLEEAISKGDFDKAKETTSLLKRSLDDNDLVKILTAKDDNLSIDQFSEINNLLVRDLTKNEVVMMLGTDKNHHERLSILEVFDIELNQDLYEAILIHFLDNVDGMVLVNMVYKFAISVMKVTDVILEKVLEKSNTSGSKGSFDNSIYAAERLNRDLTETEVRAILKNCIATGELDDVKKASEFLGEELSDKELEIISENSLVKLSERFEIAIKNESYFEAWKIADNFSEPKRTESLIVVFRLDNRYNEYLYLKTILEPYKTSMIKERLKVCVSECELSELIDIKEFLGEEITKTEAEQLVENPIFATESVFWVRKKVLDKLSKNEKLVACRDFLKRYMTTKDFSSAKEVSLLLSELEFNVWFKSLDIELMFEFHEKEEDSGVRHIMNQALEEVGVSVKMRRICIEMKILESLDLYNLILKEDDRGRMFFVNTKTEKHSNSFSRVDRVLEDGYLIVRDYDPEREAILSLETLGISDYWAPDPVDVYFKKLKDGVYLVNSMRTWPIFEVGRNYLAIVRLGDLKATNGSYGIDHLDGNYYLLRGESTSCCRSCGVTYSYQVFDIDIFISSKSFDSRDGIDRGNLGSYFEKGKVA